jgi:hypothetical protein
MGLTCPAFLWGLVDLPGGDCYNSGGVVILLSFCIPPKPGSYAESWSHNLTRINSLPSSRSRILDACLSLEEGR